jgi:hypothetical protein
MASLDVGCISYEHWIAVVGWGNGHVLVFSLAVVAGPQLFSTTTNVYAEKAV